MFPFRKLSQSDVFLIIANLLPVYGVLFLGWDAKEAFIIYCLETIIIGIYTLMKLGVITFYKSNDRWQNEGLGQKVHGVSFMLFFILHYGMFVILQMFMFFKTANINGGKEVEVFKYLMNLQDNLSTNGWIALSVFVFGYGFKMISEFLLADGHKTQSMMYIMFEPYARIIIQQFTVIIGAMVLAFGADKIFMLIFAAVKIFFAVFIDYDQMIKKTLDNQEVVPQQSNSSHS